MYGVAMSLDTYTDQDDGTLPLFVCFGFRRNARGGQVVSVEVGGAAVNKKMVSFVSNPAKRLTECWWAGTVRVSPGVTVRLETKVGVRGAGADTERSVNHWYTVDPESDMQEISVGGVGYNDYPLLRGNLKPISQRSMHDDTLASVDAMLDSLDDSD